MSSLPSNRSRRPAMLFAFTFLALTLLSSTGCGSGASAPGSEDAGTTAVSAADLTSPKDRASYGIGSNIGASLKRDGIEVNLNAMVQGLKDGIAGADLKITEAEMQEAMETVQREAGERRSGAMEEQASVNRVEGPKFLEANKAKDGVVVLPSGLQYRVLREGDGAKPKATDRVKVDYRGTTIDGTVFDSSYDRGQPAVFPVMQVIPGWIEALQLMPVGSKWELVIPPSLGYGMNVPPGAKFGPDAVLVFEVELQEIVS